MFFLFSREASSNLLPARAGFIRAYDRCRCDFFWLFEMLEGEVVLDEK